MADAVTTSAERSWATPSSTSTTASPAPLEEQKQGTSPVMKVVWLFVAVIVIILVMFFITMWMAKSRGKWRSTTWLLNGDRKFAVRTLLLGGMSAMAFGFVDNAGLFFGMDALDPYLPGGELERAGWGNTFSDGVGAFIGAFVAKMVQLATGFENGPIYADFVGIIIGCILGIYIPKAITGKE